MNKEKISIFWFRRDLRLNDNRGLSEALNGLFPVLPIFIYDSEILDELESDDPRFTFIHDQISGINEQLVNYGTSIYTLRGKPMDCWNGLLQDYDIQEVYTNEDYEPYARQRDKTVEQLLEQKDVPFRSFKDQVIFAKNDVLKGDNTPYSIYTPFKNKWIAKLDADDSVLNEVSNTVSNFAQISSTLMTMDELGFIRSKIEVPDFKIDNLDHYEDTRNFPALNTTSYLSTHLRFGTVSIRSLVRRLRDNKVFLSELIWREFFMQILYHYPNVVSSNFKKKYDYIEWRNNIEEYEKWKNGKTGYPMVDAGMRELNATGFMHNRVRMVVAGFLCKHLLIDWRWGEAYFAKKLLDYELASNNGNWQWAAGTGCDAAPYFRVFNPTEQNKKFDAKMEYIKKWVPELNSFEYPTPMVEHKMARLRAIETYKIGLSNYTQ